MSDQPVAHEPRGGADLARRLRATLDAMEQARRAAEEEEKRRQERARVRREGLLLDLEAFGQAVGHFEVTHQDQVVAWRYRGRSLRFEADGDHGSVRVRGDLTGEHSLVWQPTLAKWVWVLTPKTGPEQQRVLYDTGLQALIAQALDVEPDASVASAGAAPPSPESDRVRRKL